MTTQQFARWATLVSEPVLLVELDGATVASNTSALHMLGATRPSDLEGTPLADLVSEPSEKVAEYLSSCARSGASIPGSLTLQPALGESIACRCQGVVLNPEAKKSERIIAVRFIPKPGANESFIALNQKIAELGKEITGRKKAEADLKQSQENLRLILDSVAEGIYGVDLDGNCTFCNRATPELLGYLGAESFIGQNIHRLIHHSHPDGSALRENECPICTGSRKGRKSHMEDWILWRADGESIYTECWTHPIRIDKKMVGFVVTFIDITDRKLEKEKHIRLEEQMRQSQKLESLGVLAGGIAHDFNNLLLGVMGNADMALLDLPEMSPSRQHLEEVIESAQRAAELCRQLLAYSGRGKFVLQPVDLAEVIEDMANLLQISVNKRAVLKYDFAENLPAVEVDVTQVRQIVMNLVINASDAIGNKSGLITVSTGAMECNRAYLSETYLDDDLPEGVYIYIEVGDTGCGMDEKTRNSAFDPFFTTKQTGRGLGLAAVLGIVRSHRGALKCYSEPGRGTTFKTLFPETKQASVSIKQPEKKSSHWQGSGTVLVVDDEDTIRALARKILERVGFNVLTASDGREGLKVYRENKDAIHLVLLDMTMPHLGGEETFRELRSIDKDVRVILSSGYNEQEATSRFTGKGLAGFIQKPYRAQELIDLLRTILADEDD